MYFVGCLIHFLCQLIIIKRLFNIGFSPQIYFLSANVGCGSRCCLLARSSASLWLSAVVDGSGLYCGAVSCHGRFSVFIVCFPFIILALQFNLRFCTFLSYHLVLTPVRSGISSCRLCSLFEPMEIYAM